WRRLALFFMTARGPPRPTLFPYTTLFRSQGTELGAVRAATRQPGELFAQLQADDVDPLRQSGIAAKGQRRHAVTAVREIGSDLHPPGRHGDEGGRIPSLR